MPDDPFAGLGLDRTVLMPSPGGRTAAPKPAAPWEQVEPIEAAVTSSGLNPLVAMANPLLNIVPQLRGSMEHTNPGALRDTLAKNVRDFEARARASGVTTERVIAARYAL